MKELVALGITRGRVQQLEAAMRDLPPAMQVDPKSLVTRHHFPVPGIYMREVHIPAGMTTTGKIHKRECVSFLTKGRRSTLIDGRIVEITAPHMHLSPPGMKRVTYTHEDSIWVTVHSTNLTDVAELERELVCETEEEYLAFISGGNIKCLS